MEYNTELMEQTIPEEDVETETIGEDTDAEAEGLNWWDDEEETADEEDSETEETEENEEETEEQENEEQTSEAEEMFPQELIVYGEKKQVTMTEAKNLIQKGLAYDRAIEVRDGRLQTALNDPRLAFVDELAKEAGMDATKYMTNVRNQRQYATLIENFGSLDAVPKDVMQMFTDNVKAAEEKAEQELKEKQKAEADRQLDEEFWNFMEKHPGLSEIPKEVVQLKADGHSLEGAYAIYENKQLKADKEKLEREIAVLKQNNKNKQTKMPSSQNKGKKVSKAEAWWD